MNYEWLQNFLSSPELPDIISYIFVGITLIAQIFVKKFVKKDNMFTAEKVNVKITKVNDLYAKLEESDKKHNKERSEWKQERKELKKEIEMLKQAVRLCSSNSKDLVKCGVSNKIAKLLPISEENAISEINIEYSVNYGSSNSDVEVK